MARRHKIGRHASERNFSRRASMTHRKNLNVSRPVMRGGIRL